MAEAKWPSRIVGHSHGTPASIGPSKQFPYPAAESLIGQIVVDEHTKHRTISARRKSEAELVTSDHSALPYRELPAFMAELRAQDGLAARALEFAILTAARTGEVTGANPKEFDLRHAVWTIPAARMKAKREHRVPLSSRASEIARESECEFPLSNMAMLMLLRRMGRADLTVRGFRSTFRDWAAEEANAPRELAEMALAHTIGSNTEAAYRRGDLFERRRELMNAWDKYCNGSDRRSG